MTTGVGIKFDRARTVDIRSVGIIKSDAELIAESIHRIINTSFGERPRNFSFGSGIRNVLFEQSDYTTNTLGSYYIAEAIERLEPRVTIETIFTTRDSNDRNKLIVNVVFREVENPETLFQTNVVIQ